MDRDINSLFDMFEDDILILDSTFRLLPRCPSPLTGTTLGQAPARVSTSFHKHTRMMPALRQL